MYEQELMITRHQERFINYTSLVLNLTTSL